MTFDPDVLFVSTFDTPIMLPSIQLSLVLSFWFKGLVKPYGQGAI
jgi:hypothetical protein